MASEPKLSDTQRWALLGITDEWAKVPYDVGWPTIDALRRKGVIEWRLEGVQRQWRKVQKDPPNV